VPARLWQQVVRRRDVSEPGNGLTCTGPSARISRGANFIAYAGEAAPAAGIAGAVEPEPGVAELVSM
jgi:hypothetical protein